MWKKYFKVIKIIPGEVVVPGYGKLDFRKDNISVEVCRDLLENDFPYLAITEEGKNFLYGTPSGTSGGAAKKMVVKKSIRL